MLTVKDLHSYYDKAHILHGVSLNVEDRQVVCLIGKNGMGKSTAVKSIMGIAPPQVKGGHIAFDSRDITHWPSNRVARLGISYVPEERRIFPLLTVQENLTLGLDVVGALRGEKEQALRKIYEYFPRLQERLGQLGEGLSGGEQQMLAIARAMIMKPRLILMDEPTEGLMPLLVQEIKRIILTLKQEADLGVAGRAERRHGPRCERRRLCDGEGFDPVSWDAEGLSGGCRPDEGIVGRVRRF